MFASKNQTVLLQGKRIISLTHEPESQLGRCTRLNFDAQQLLGRGEYCIKLIRVVKDCMSAGEHLEIHRLDFDGHSFALNKKLRG